jgi:hypothetical protein
MARLLENKVVIVAGLGGIGNVLARRFAGVGALLVVGGLDGMHVNFANTADAYLPGGVVELPLEVFHDVMRVNTRASSSAPSMRFPR